MFNDILSEGIKPPRSHQRKGFRTPIQGGIKHENSE